MIHTALTIAGSDPIGGAGIQADIKTMAAHGVYAMSVVTAVVAENTMGVYGIFDVPPAFVGRQIDCVFTDIAANAVKIGMVSSPDTVRVIAERLAYYGARRVVVDPVMVATSGGTLMAGGTAKALQEALFPLAAIITPNIPEAEALTGQSIACEEDMARAAKKIADECGAAVLVKGGHLTEEAADCLYAHGTLRWFRAPRVNNPNTHGTGCTLSSAIACALAKGASLEQSVRSAKAYLTGALQAGLALGHGSGPLDHQYSAR